MKTWLRLLIPVALGMIAVWLNTTIMTEKLKPKFFVVVTRDVGVDDVFSVNNVEPRSLNENVAKLLQSAIPWDDRAVLMGRSVSRPLQRGDLVLWRDATPPAKELSPNEGEASLPVSLQDVDIIPNLLLVGEMIVFYVDGNLVGPKKSGTTSDAANANDIIKAMQSSVQAGMPSRDPEPVGPFRLLSVGKRLTRTTPDGTTSQDGQVITIAIPVDKQGKTDSKTNLLMRARSQRGGVLSVALHRSNRSPSAIRDRHDQPSPDGE